MLMSDFTEDFQVRPPLEHNTWQHCWFSSLFPSIFYDSDPAFHHRRCRQFIVSLLGLFTLLFTSDHYSPPVLCRLITILLGIIMGCHEVFLQSGWRTGSALVFVSASGNWKGRKDLWGEWLCLWLWSVNSYSLHSVVTIGDFLSQYVNLLSRLISWGKPVSSWSDCSCPAVWLHYDLWFKSNHCHINNNSNVI